MSEEKSYSFEAHPASTKFEHLYELYELGFRRLSIGVQDVSPDILKAINRKQTAEEIKFVTSSARNIGYESVSYDLIYGLPFQKQKHLEKTMDFVSEMKPDRIAFYSYAHVPWKSKSQRAFTKDDSLHGYEKYNLKCYGDNRLTKLGYIPVGMDHYALPNDNLAKASKEKTIHRNFMGYTDHKPNVLLGLGCSAISETKSVYVQNIKEVEGYKSGVAEEGLALLKGHQLSKEEQIIKKHISQIFCNAFTSWKEDSIDAHVLNTTSPILSDMHKDGFIVLDDCSITVNKAGTNFIRNICAALDPKFHANSVRMFSQGI